MSLERLWAGWRAAYLESMAGTGRHGGDGGEVGECILCRILATADDEDACVVRRAPGWAAILNAYPYTSGHLMVLPTRHVAEPEELERAEGGELWAAVIDAVRAVKAAYRPDGVNLGANLGQASGAGVPGHFHVHVLPRWNGDTNFMTTVAEARVLPEPLSLSWRKLRDAWPG